MSSYNYAYGYSSGRSSTYRVPSGYYGLSNKCLPRTVAITDNSKFNVNGHFRLQPYGKERQLKKIIWINEFKKSGYVRQAKILTSV